MTDDRMDARLRAAGETWRADHSAVATPSRPATELETLSPNHPRRPRRTGLFASAAVVAAALVAGGAFLLNNSGDGNGNRNGDSAAVEGTVWRLTGYDGDHGTNNSLSTFYIGPDGSLVADDSCMVIGAHANVDAGHLHPTNFDIRYRDCTDSVGEVTFTKAIDLLTSGPSFSVDGTALTIGAPGQPSMHLVAAPDLLPPTTDVPTFLGAKWQLTKVTDGQGADHPVVGAPTLQVREGRLSTSDGCNTLGGEVAIQNGKVDLKAVSSTAIGCTGPVSTTAAVIDTFFSADTLHETVRGTTLTITGGGGSELVYEWVSDDPAATDPTNLIGKTWHLVSVAGEPAADPIDLRIDKDGQVRTSDGCKPLVGTARVGSGSLALNLVENLTAINCQHPQGTTIGSFLTSDPVLWSIRDGKLLIYGGGAQAFSLVYETAAGSSPSASPTEPLLGKTWTLAVIETKDGNTSSGEGASDSGVTLTFDAKGGYRLGSHCNVWLGSVDIRDGSAVFTNRHSGGGVYDACLDQSLEHASAVLDGTVTWKINNGQLVVTKGNTTLTFDP